MVFCMASIEYKGEREGEERKKKEKQFQVKQC
jgi:hypothetical protein